MTVVLYNPVSSAGRKPVLPMSLLALGAVLEGERDYVIVDGNLAGDALETLDRTVRERDAPPKRVSGTTKGPKMGVRHY